MDEELERIISEFNSNIETLSNRIQTLESTPDKDTIYDDTELKNRVNALEHGTVVNVDTSVLVDRVNDLDNDIYKLEVNVRDITSRLDSMKKDIDRLSSYFANGVARAATTGYAISTSRKVSDTNEYKAIWYED